MHWSNKLAVSGCKWYHKIEQNNINKVLRHTPVGNMATANQHKLIFVKQTNEPGCEKEHVDISDTAKFLSCRPNTGEMADI